MFIKLLRKELAGRLFGGAKPQLPPDRERHHGSWHGADLEWMAKSVRNVPGDFAEIGVYRGAAFRRLAALAHEQSRIAHAFDSFHGMGDPGPEDGEHYPKGKFVVGGPESFMSLMDDAGVPRDHYRLWPGYVPFCFEPFPGQARFSLVLIDVDHYQPTAESLRWAAPRVSRGGILALDDYIPATELLATKAIKEFLARESRFEPVAEFNQQLILRRK
jgi:O-methyltransferase